MTIDEREANEIRRAWGLKSPSAAPTPQSQSPVTDMAAIINPGINGMVMAELRVQAKGNLARAQRDYLVARVTYEWATGMLGEREPLASNLKLQTSKKN